ncbi:MAG: 23S rRNA (uracil(1939)-C(5))-methyltransferase RlmD [Firmicutes bacterium]|nr:23S rRNA (uracil(1939)-C(5))-methyltransferase RlmD [Bacillota bacterium]
MKKNEKYTIDITDITTNGEGIGKVDGYPLFVKDALPEERAEVVVTKVKKSYGYAKVLNIQTPSPYRVEPACKLKRCGGCSLSHLEYSRQLKYKEKKVFENIKRIGGFNTEEITFEPIIGMEEPYRYRNKAQYPVGEKEGKMISGFYAVNSHDIIPCKDCLICSYQNSPIVEDILAFAEENHISPYDEKTKKGIIRHILIRENKKGEILLCLIVNAANFPLKKKFVNSLRKYPHIVSLYINYNTKGNNVILGDKSEHIFGRKTLTDTIGSLKFEISPESFFQVNHIQTEKLYEKALEYASLKGTETVIDAYCGIGTISLFLAQKAKKVYGMEIVEEAVKDAEKNKKANNADNVVFYVGKSEEILPDMYQKGIKAQVLVTDPPRKGCDENFLNIIKQMRPQKIVYVSCESSTLARDLKILCKEGYYKVEKVCPVDLFPHTSHVETVVLLSQPNSDEHIATELDLTNPYQP